MLEPWDIWGRGPLAPNGQLLHVSVCWGGPRCSGAAGPRLLGSAQERVLAAVVPMEQLLVMLRWLKQMSPSVRPLRWRESQGDQFLREGEKLQPYLFLTSPLIELTLS